MYFHIFGGDNEIVIKLGGPEKAYDENLFEEMLKDILPMVSTSKKYKKEEDIITTEYEDKFSAKGNPIYFVRTKYKGE